MGELQSLCRDTLRAWLPKCHLMHIECGSVGKVSVEAGVATTSPSSSSLALQEMPLHQLRWRDLCCTTRHSNEHNSQHADTWSSMSAGQYGASALNA
ncbi:unnamed protein product [Hydatigera taeniaeformis]|uniref:Uncharacterized protein n=1 Tax=Hydatigena taeniaeformis TaxID=6205 RepID=A0A0R3XDL0_HYDTA|nr:unnamed protein product [Hydatigera taeniaeformis]